MAYQFTMACVTFPAPIILYSVTRLLWAIDGWSRSNAVSNLSSRVPLVTEGILPYIYQHINHMKLDQMNHYSLLHLVLHHDL